MDERDPVTPGGLRLDPACLSWRFSRAGGPGGQHVNTSSTRVELRCSLADAGLPDAVFERIAAKLGTDLRVVSSTERSQLRNRRRALERLADRLDEAAEIAVPRHATRPSRSQRQARLEDKHRRSQRKADRRYRPGDD